MYAHVPVAAFPMRRDANGSVRGEVQRDHRRDDAAANPAMYSPSVTKVDDPPLTLTLALTREHERITPVLPTIPRGRRTRVRDSNITGVPHRRVSARERADDAVGAPAPAALAAAPPPRPREFTARHPRTATTGASDGDDAGIVAASPYHATRASRAETFVTRPALPFSRASRSSLFSLLPPRARTFVANCRIRANFASLTTSPRPPRARRGNFASLMTSPRSRARRAATSRR